MDSLLQYFLMSLISMAASLIVAFTSIYFKDYLETHNIIKSLKAELETNKITIDKILALLHGYKLEGVKSLIHIPYYDRLLSTNYNALLYSGKFHRLSPEARLRIITIYDEIKYIQRESKKQHSFHIDDAYELLSDIRNNINAALKLLQTGKLGWVSLKRWRSSRFWAWVKRKARECTLFFVFLLGIPILITWIMGSMGSLPFETAALLISIIIISIVVGCYFLRRCLR